MSPFGEIEFGDLPCGRNACVQNGRIDIGKISRERLPECLVRNITNAKTNLRIRWPTGRRQLCCVPIDTLTGAVPTPAIMTLNASADVALAQNQADNVSGEGGNGSVQQSPYTYDFNSLYCQLSQMADYSFTGSQSFTSSSPSYGSYTNPKVTVVNGNLSCGGNCFKANVGKEDDPSR